MFALITLVLAAATLGYDAWSRRDRSRYHHTYRYIGKRRVLWEVDPKMREECDIGGDLWTQRRKLAEDVMARSRQGERIEPWLFKQALDILSESPTPVAAATANQNQNQNQNQNTKKKRKKHDP